MELTQEILLELLRYDPETGKLFWKPREAKWFTEGYRSAQGCADNWNSKNANQIAFDTLTASGYKTGTLFGKKYKFHRILWLYIYGDWPDIIDHINGQPGDNRLENLRSVSHQENMKNTKKRKDNTSGITGVSYSIVHNRWKVKIRNYEGSCIEKWFLNFEQAKTYASYLHEKFGYSSLHGKR